MQRLSVPDRLDPARYLWVSRVAGARYPFRIDDPTGATQSLRSPPQRIVSASFPSDEILALLVDQSRVVSVSKGADDAGINNAAGHYGSQVNRNKNGLEELIALKPDLLVTRDAIDASVAETLMASGIVVLRLSFYDSFAGVTDNTLLMAKLLGVEERGKQVIADMWHRLAAVEAAVRTASKPRLLWYNSNGSGSTPGTLNDEMILRAGARNIVRETKVVGRGKLPSELAIQLRPDVIIIGAWMNGEETRQELLISPQWQDVPAVRNGRVHLINSAWGTTGTPYRVRGVEQLARILHPERFPV